MSESDYSVERDDSQRNRQKKNKHDKPDRNKERKKRSISLESDDERKKKKKRKSRNQSSSGDESYQEKARIKKDKTVKSKKNQEGKYPDYKNVPEYNDKNKKDKRRDYKDGYERSPDLSKKSSHKLQSSKKDNYEPKDVDNYSGEFDEEERGSKKSHSKSKKYAKDDRKSNKRKNREYGEDDEFSKGRQRKDEGFEEELSRSLDKKENKRTSRKRHDKDSGRGETETLDEEDDEVDKDREGFEKPFRYWSSSRGPIRKNSDSYWNKYADRLKEKESLPDVVAVGPRYYGSSEGSKKDRKKEDNDDNVKDDIEEKKEKETPEVVVKPAPRKASDMLTTRTGGAYIPPARLRMMQESITDKSSAAYQRLAWEALKKSIQGHVNKVSQSNIKEMLRAVQKENIVRGRGLLCRCLIQAQASSLLYTNVYAAFVAALNAKFPKIGELLLKRLVVQFRRGFKRNDKTICITAATFIAHLVNQEVAHEILALEMLTLLIETPTDDSVEVAIAFLKECGMKLTEVSSKGVLAIFDMLRNILHEGKLEKRVQYMIEVMFQVRKEDFKAHPSIAEGLDLVEEEDRIQHMITLEDNHDPEDILNVFKLDPNYEENEAKYKTLVEVDSDEDSDEDGSGSSGSEDSGDESEGGEGETEGKKDIIVDRTETNLIALRKTIYLTIQSSLDFEECAHKLLRMELKPGQEIEMAHMFLDCCAEQRTYEKFYGLLSQRFCQINRAYIGPFEETFRDSYSTVHRMSNDKLRNVGKLFAHLLYTDAISWEVLSAIRLNEDETTSSSRIFIKILFLELSEYMGLAKLNQRVKDPSLQTALDGLFPRDNPKHTRFAINFFTSIGLGGLTDELREHLKSQPKPSAVPQLVEGLSSSSSSSDSSSESSDSSDSSSSDSSSSDSEEEATKKKKKKKQEVKTSKNKKPVEKKPTKKQKNVSPKRKRDR